MINSRFEKRLTISIQITNNRDRKYQEPMQEKKQTVREKQTIPSMAKKDTQQFTYTGG